MLHRALIALPLLLAGCATVATLVDERDYDRRLMPYAGVQLDLTLIDLARLLPARQPVHGNMAIGPVAPGLETIGNILGVLAILDLPLSFVADTALLPLTGLRWFCRSRVESPRR